MAIYPLVFSNNPRYRVSRHIFFWLLWIVYFTFMYTFGRWDGIPFQKAFTSSLAEICVFTPVDILHCYAIIYFLLPRFLFRGRYLMFISLWLLITILAITVTQLELRYIIMPMREGFGIDRPIFRGNLFYFYYNNFAFYNMQGCLAAAIKLGKMWYIKQQELSLVTREKQQFSMQSRQGIMQPVFLLNALESIKQQSVQQPAVVPAMLSRIKNLLLYVIYDHNQSRVPLKKELQLLEEYLLLEKVGTPGLCTSLEVEGNMEDDSIAPFILLPLAENSFRQLNALPLTERKMDIRITLEDGWMKASLSWNKPTDTAALQHGVSGFLKNVQKRLELLYPESHELRVVIGADRFTVNALLNLRRAIA